MARFVNRKLMGFKLLKYKNKILILFWILFSLYIFYRIFLFGFIKNECIDINKKTVRGVIVNFENAYGNGALNYSFTYSYMFKIGDNYYYEDSRDENYKVGDSIWVEYFPIYPHFSRIVNAK